MTDLLLVYGSLRSDVDRGSLPREARDAAAFLSAAGERAAAATLPGRLHAVAWYPGLVIGRDAPDAVYGELWRLSDPGVALIRLDAYEGGEYHREIVDVRADDGAIVSAWVYVYDAPLGDAPVIDSGDYAHWIAQQTP